MKVLPATVPCGPMRRRSLLLVAAAQPLAVLAAAEGLPAARDLRAEAVRAAAAGQPLVVQVDLKHCPFCRIVRENFLAPLHRSEGLPVVQVDMQGEVSVHDFGGRAIEHRELARAWGVKLAPTVLFFGPRGTEIAERLVGAMLPDFYGAYLDERLRSARAALLR